MRKVLIVILLSISGSHEVSAQTDTLPGTLKQYEYYKYLWDEQSPNFQISFPFRIEHFDQPTLFKHYSRNSRAAYGTSRYLIPDWESIRRSDEDRDPLSRFLYQPEDSNIRYNPQEVFCLYRLDEVTDSIELFANNIRALVIPASFADYIKSGRGADVKKVLEAFKNVTYLELGDVNNQVNTKLIMELILENKSFDQVEYLCLNNITMEQTMYIHERYRKLKSLCIRNIENQQNFALPNPFLTCLDLSVLNMPIPSDSTTGSEFSHLTKLESVIFFDGYIPISHSNLEPLSRLEQLYFQTTSDTILFRNNSIELLDITVVTTDKSPAFVSIDGSGLRSLSITTYNDATVKIFNLDNIRMLDIYTLENMNLQLKSQAKSLREISLTAGTLDFYSRKGFPENLIIYLKDSMEINYQKGSKKLPIQQKN